MIIDANCELGEYLGVSLEPAALIARMDTYNIDHALISPMMGRDMVTGIPTANDRIAQAVRAYPGRFVGVAVANPWYGDEAVAELRRAVERLGFCALKMHSVVQGFPVNHPLVYPLVEEAIRLDIPIFLHSGTAPYALPLQVADLARCFPEAKIIMSHVGYSNFWGEAYAAFAGLTATITLRCASGTGRCASAGKQPAGLYGELSCQPHIPALQRIINEVGSRRFMYASFSPFSHPELELAKVRLLALPPEEEQALLGGTIRQLIGERWPL